MSFFISLSVFLSVAAWANPYPDPNKVRNPIISTPKSSSVFEELTARSGSDVLRVEILWSEGEKYEVTGLFHEKSGTPALISRARSRDALGSYQARLILPNKEVLFASVGTGIEFRKLVLTMSFRFPLPENFTEGELILNAENPQTGKSEKVLSRKISKDILKLVPEQEIKVTLLRRAKKEPALKVNFYAEGFFADGEMKFLEGARKAIATLEKGLPGSEYFEFRAVFAPSRLKIGSSKDLGPKPIERDSFLGLYFPHWHKFGRWYHVVYPTSQTRYRNALAQADYDYPIALVDDGDYWGVGNYKELTAVPVSNFAFSFLLLHEFGHFMGLNEEYESGGPTELRFAPGIKEPWSQNITFHPGSSELKWFKVTEPGISLPTTLDDYHRHGGSLKNPVGAYPGGYADSDPQKRSYKPVMKCTMSTEAAFCPVCQHALEELVKFDRGE